MIKQNRWLCLFLAFLLFAGPALPAQAAEADFASFLIDGDEMDFPQRPLHIQLYPSLLYEVCTDGNGNSPGTSKRNLSQTALDRKNCWL